MWYAILKKELRLQRDFMIGAFIVITVMGVSGLLLTATGHPAPAALLVAVPMLWHFLFLPIYMLSSLKQEWKHSISTWMQMPMPGWKLLLAKLSSGLIYFLGTFTISALFLILSLRIGLEGKGPVFEELLSGMNLTELVGGSLLFFLGIYLYTNLVLAPFFIAFSVLRQWMRGTVTKFAGFLSLVLGAAIIWLFAAVSETEIYHSLSAWGEFGYPVESLEVGPFYTGEILFDLLISVLFIAGAGWLIDRKVQV